MKNKPLSSISFYIEVLEAVQNIWIFFMGKSYYRDINLYFVYDKQYKQWFTSGHDFFNEAICEKVTNRNFNLKAFGKIIPKRKEITMQLVMNKGKLWVEIDTI